MGLTFDHHALTLYEHLKREGAVSLQLWTDVDGGEHAAFSRPPPLQRKSPVPLFPEGLPTNIRRRRAPTNRARDIRRRKSPPFPSDPTSRPPETYSAAPSTPVAHGPSGTSGPRRASAHAPCPLAVTTLAPGPQGPCSPIPQTPGTLPLTPGPLGETAPAPGPPGSCSPVSSTPETLSLSPASPRPEIATPPCSRHVPFTRHLPPSLSPILQLDGDVLSPQNPPLSPGLTPSTLSKGDGQRQTLSPLLTPSPVPTAKIPTPKPDEPDLQPSPSPSPALCPTPPADPSPPLQPDADEIHSSQATPVPPDKVYRTCDRFRKGKCMDCLFRVNGVIKVKVFCCNQRQGKNKCRYHEHDFTENCIISEK